MSSPSFKCQAPRFSKNSEILKGKTEEDKGRITEDDPAGEASNARHAGNVVLLKVRVALGHCLGAVEQSVDDDLLIFAERVPQSGALLFRAVAGPFFREQAVPEQTHPEFQTQIAFTLTIVRQTKTVAFPRPSRKRPADTSIKRRTTYGRAIGGRTNEIPPDPS